MCQAPLALLDELLTQMGLAGFTPADIGADEGSDAGLLSRWAGVDAGAMAGEPPTTVIEAAERRIQLDELSLTQLRVLLVKLGGADAGGEHLQMDKRALLRAAREAMGAAPLVLLDEARASSFELQPTPGPAPNPNPNPKPSPPHVCIHTPALARPTQACIELQRRAEAERAAVAAGERPPRDESDDGSDGDSDGSSSEAASTRRSGPSLSARSGAAARPAEHATDSAGASAGRRLSSTRLARHAARVEKLHSMRAGLHATGSGAVGGTGRAGGAADGGAALLKVGVAPSQATLGALGSLSRLGNTSAAIGSGGGGGGGGVGGGGPGPKDRRKQGGGRVRGAALREAEAAAEAAEAAEETQMGLQLFQGLARRDAAEVSLVPVAKAEAPRDRFQLHKLSAAQLGSLLRTLGGTAPPEPPPPLVAGGAAATEAAAAHQAALVAAMKQAMAAAPLALLDEVCLEIEAASAAKPRPRRHAGNTGHAGHADGTASHSGGSRHRSASGGGAASGTVGGDAAGGSEGRHGRSGIARTSSKDGKEDGTPRERRRRSSREGEA